MNTVQAPCQTCQTVLFIAASALPPRLRFMTRKAKQNNELCRHSTTSSAVLTNEPHSIRICQPYRPCTVLHMQILRQHIHAGSTSADTGNNAPTHSGTTPTQALPHLHGWRQLQPETHTGRVCRQCTFAQVVHHCRLCARAGSAPTPPGDDPPVQLAASARSRWVGSQAAHPRCECPGPPHSCSPGHRLTRPLIDPQR